MTLLRSFLTSTQGEVPISFALVSLSSALVSYWVMNETSAKVATQFNAIAAALDKIR